MSRGPLPFSPVPVARRTSVSLMDRRAARVGIVVAVVVVLAAAILVFLKLAYGSQLAVDCEEGAPAECFSLPAGTQATRP